MYFLCSEIAWLESYFYALGLDHSDSTQVDRFAFSPNFQLLRNLGYKQHLFFAVVREPTKMTKQTS